MKPSGRPRARNPERAAKNFERAYHSQERIEFVRGEPCAACSFYRSENAHIENGGMSRKADYKLIAPLCGPRGGYIGCHNLLDKVLGRKRFEKKWGIDLARVAAETEEKWLARASVSQAF